VPHLGSLILTHSWDGQIKGLKEFAPEDRPNATIIFWTFRIMVGLGTLMILLGLWSLWLRFKHKLYENRQFLKLTLWMGPAGIVAILAGWFTTEIGRQPWVVYGVMRTADAASKHEFSTLALSLGLFLIVYLFVFGIGFAYVLRLVRKGPTPHEGDLPNTGGPGEDRHSMRPISAAEEDLSVEAPFSDTRN